MSMPGSSETGAPGRRPLNVVNRLQQGLTGYDEGLALQQYHHQQVKQGGNNTIIFLEHAPVITLGKRGEIQDIVASQAVLDARGVAIRVAERGGQVTFHGPGQLVGYCIADLSKNLRSIRAFVEGIELALVGYLQQRYGLTAHLENDHPGIWVGSQKVAAVGIAIREKVSLHGFALNIDVDPAWFSLIVPCGIRDRQTVSVATLVPDGKVDSLQECADGLTPLLNQAFGAW